MYMHTSLHMSAHMCMYTSTYTHAHTPPGNKTSCIVSTGAQYRTPTSQEVTAMKLGPGPKGAKRVPQESPKHFLRNLGRPSAAHTKGGGRLQRPPPFVCPRFLKKGLGDPWAPLWLS